MLHVAMESASRDDYFRYEPLDKVTKIRLMRIIENNANEALRCELETFDLDTTHEIPKYAALSYTWGYPKDRVPMLCHGKLLPITTKLDEALRKTHVHNSTRYIWVDQVCINQEDLEEKGEQISLMTGIFQLAWIVIAWLGPADDSTELAIEQAVKVANTWRSEHLDDPSLPFDEDFDPTSLPRGEHELTSAALYASYGEDGNAWLALSRLFDRPWFERVWIVQEMINATTWGATRRITTYCVCGEFKLPWLIIHHAAIWMWDARCHQREPPADSNWTVDGVNHAAHLRGTGYFTRMAKMATTEGEVRSIGTYQWGVLNTFRNFAGRKATDPKDVFSALVGLTDFTYSPTIAGVKNSLMVRRTRIAIDHTLSMKDTFRDFAKGLIMWYQDHHLDKFPPLDFAEKDGAGPLDILLDAGVSRLDLDWPSWVPDWRLPKQYNLPTSFASKRKPDTASPTLYPHPNPDLLSLAGVVLGEVSLVNTHEHASQTLIDCDPRDISKFLEQELGPIYHHGLGGRRLYGGGQPKEGDTTAVKDSVKQESTATAFLWSLSAGIVPPLFRHAGISAEIYEQDEILYKFLDVLRKYRNDDGLYSLGDEEWDFCKPLKNVVNAGSVAHFHGNCRAYLCHRRMFVTDNGYIGTAHEDVQEGDVVALLYGMSTPVVLRPSETNDGEMAYRLIGDAWTRGVMNGEVIDDWNEIGDPPQQIVLC